MKDSKKKILKWIKIVCVISILCTGTIFVGLNAYMYSKTDKLLIDCLDDANITAEISNENDFKPRSPTYIYANDKKTVIAKLTGNQAAEYLNYNKIPKNICNAFVSIEDKTFWSNNGFDMKAMMRAALSVIKSGSFSQGGSTITQQLTRMIYLNQGKTIERKVQEIFLSYYLTEKYSKEQIIEYYINNCCFSNNIYGIQDAAKNYFNKEVQQLSLSQMAYLCAIPNRPEYYNPWKTPQNPIKRRNRILKAMLEDGYIHQKDYNKAIQEKITITPQKTIPIKYDYETTFAIKCSVEYFMKQNGFYFEYQWDSLKDYQNYNKRYKEFYDEAKEQLYNGGYKIYTSFDLKKQKEIQRVVNKHLSSYKKLNKSSNTYNLQAATTVIDNQTHKVVAIVGGRKNNQKTINYTLNRAFQSKRQPGSSIKPLVVYTPGIEKGANRYTTLKNISVKYAYRHPSQIPYMGGARMSLSEAVRKSQNGCALYLFYKTGINNGMKKLVQMNFANIVPADYNLTSGLGGLTYGTTTYEMANAYSTLANDGCYDKATCIISIKESNETELYRDYKSVQVYTKKASQEMTSVLKGVVKSGTAHSINWSSYSNNWAAGKTGTTNNNKDAWFCGYTQRYSSSVWVGNDDNTVTNGITGGSLPAKIWRDIILIMGE